MKTGFFYHKLPNGTFRYLPPHQSATGMPNDATYLTVIADEGKAPSSPPKAILAESELRSWLREMVAAGCQLEAQDFQGNPKAIRLD